MAEYLKVWADDLEQYRKLSDAEYGRLIRAALHYKRTGEEPQLTGREELMWDGKKLEIDRDKERQNSVSNSRAEAGRKGAAARWQSDSKNSKDSKCHLPYGKNGYDKDKDYIPPLPPTGELFGRFWAAYPKKVGKANCERWFARHKVDEETLQAMLESLAYLKTTEQWQKDGGQYIPNPQTWLNGRRWEDESAKPPKREKVSYIGKL